MVRSGVKKGDLRVRRRLNNKLTRRPYNSNVIIYAIVQMVDNSAYQLFFQRQWENYLE